MRLKGKSGLFLKLVDSKPWDFGTVFECFFVCTFLYVACNRFLFNFCNIRTPIPMGYCHNTVIVGISPKPLQRAIIMRTIIPISLVFEFFWTPKGIMLHTRVNFFEFLLCCWLLIEGSEFHINS